MKTINFNALKHVLSAKELKNVLGGSDIIDGGWLPEAGITCGRTSGACWKCNYVHIGSYSVLCRSFDGSQNEYCNAQFTCKEAYEAFG